jgi:hypothetical protein
MPFLGLVAPDGSASLGSNMKPGDNERTKRCVGGRD